MSDVSDSQLKTVFPDNVSPGRNATTSYTPLARIEKKGIDHWAKYPLDTAMNIRKWQQACTGLKSDDTENRSPKEGAPSSDTKHYKDTRRELDHTEHIMTHDPRTISGGQDRQISVPSGLRGHREEYTRSSSIPHWGLHQSEEPFEDSEPDRGEDTLPVINNSSWDGAPSANFQQQFLW
ncbi:hypothetical protein N7454_006930 [Penicillium verhagenii]|nr:hypothetical protein N7454_006930 [Penicillium verhagenii]